VQQLRPRPLSSVSATELVAGSVWAFVPESDDHDETWVVPVQDIPVRSLEGRVAALRVRLANGTAAIAILGNVNLSNARTTRHFMAASVALSDSTWFHLARYHDVNFGRDGPQALAKVLHLPLSAVFPISYDLGAIAEGEAGSLRGHIDAEPHERLSKADLVALAVP